MDVHKTFESIYLMYSLYKHNANDWNGSVCVDIKSSSSVILSVTFIRRAYFHTQ